MTKKHKYTLKPLLITLLLSVLSIEYSYASVPPDSLFRTVLFQPGDFHSAYYRIPAIITTRQGTLVATADKRKFSNGDLPEDIDVVVTRSSDGGTTWEAPITIAKGEGRGRGYGDCALVQSSHSGTLFALFAGGCGFWESTAEQPIRIFQSSSNDDGATWSEPRDITPFIYGTECKDSVRRNWQGAFIASGNGLEISNGRLLFVAAVREDVHNPYATSNFVIFSDDNGISWSVSQRAAVGGDEAKVVELDDGTILMSIRCAGQRRFNRSGNHGATWQEHTGTWSDLVAPACNGDIIRYEMPVAPAFLLHSLPSGSQRDSVTVYLSPDQGKTWPIHRCVAPYASAYSSLCVLPNGKIGLLVEEAEDGTDRYSIVFYRFPLDWLLR